MIIYSLDILPSQFWTSPLFHVSSNCCFLTYRHIGFQGDRKGGLVFQSVLRIFKFVVIHTVKDFVLFVVQSLSCVRLFVTPWTAVCQVSLSFTMSWSLLKLTFKGFSVISIAEVDISLESPCFLYEPTDVGNLISCFSIFSKSKFYIWKFLVRICF